jgi:rhodanese-related sulfurtransferase
MILTALAGTDTLSGHLDDPDWIVFDCRHDLATPERCRAEYAQSHIPGARFLHLDEDLSAPKTGKNGRHPLPDPEHLAEKLGQAGVDSRKQVIAVTCPSPCWTAAGTSGWPKAARKPPRFRSPGPRASKAGRATTAGSVRISFAIIWATRPRS